MDFIDRYKFWLPHINRVTLEEDQRVWLLSFLALTLPSRLSRAKTHLKYLWGRLWVLSHITPTYVMYSMLCCDTGRFYRASRYGWEGWRWPGLVAWRQTRPEDLHNASDGQTYYWLISKREYRQWHYTDDTRSISPDRIARILYRMGIPPNASSGICGRTTYGYGNLDNHGYWRYMLRVEE